MQITRRQTNRLIPFRISHLANINSIPFNTLRCSNNISFIIYPSKSTRSRNTNARISHPVSPNKSLTFRPNNFKIFPTSFPTSNTSSPPSPPKLNKNYNRSSSKIHPSCLQATRRKKRRQRERDAFPVGAQNKMEARLVKRRIGRVSVRSILS